MEKVGKRLYTSSGGISCKNFGFFPPLTPVYFDFYRQNHTQFLCSFTIEMRMKENIHLCSLKLKAAEFGTI